MKCLTKRGFTLVELMVVIAIIGVLATTLVTQVSRVQNYARAAKCKANLKNLMIAAQNYSVDHGVYTAAGSYEFTPWSHDYRDSSGELKPIYYGQRAWVSWTSGGGAWPWKDAEPSNQDFSKKQQYGQMTRSTFFGDKAFVSITNGTLWELTGKDASVYVCETHKVEAKKVLKNEKVYRSYVMSHCFKWDSPDGHNNKRSEEGEAKVTNGNGNLWHTDDAIMDGKASIRLLFAELPAADIRKDNKKYTDSVLESDEPIGFNHFLGRKWVAHVAFLDGHVEGLILPSSAKTDGTGIPNYRHNDLEKLTKWLCEATEIESELREKMR